jgi:HSP20 family molecular chaperone IbpA
LTVQGSRGDGDRKREIFKRMNVSHSEKVEAEIKDGILTLTFKQPEKKTTKLDIK